jgi:hypothetical protein
MAELVDGYEYKGLSGDFDFEDGVYTGQYLEIDIDHVIYGTRFDKIPHGTGTRITDAGNKYEGSWYNGKYHGEAKQTMNTGDVYEGSYVGGFKEGAGTYNFARGTLVTFEGTWKNGFPTTGKIIGGIDKEVLYEGNIEMSPIYEDNGAIDSKYDWHGELFWQAAKTATGEYDMDLLERIYCMDQDVIEKPSHWE